MRSQGSCQSEFRTLKLVSSTSSIALSVKLSDLGSQIEPTRHQCDGLR